MGYFLIVWDFLARARDQGIPVGPGGSGAGCIVAYVLKITDLIRSVLVLFERPLQERVSPPDFGMFCMRRRDGWSTITAYLQEDRVANIITFGTFGAKMVIRDLAQVNDLDFADRTNWGDGLRQLNISLDDSVKNRELASEVNRNPIARICRPRSG